MEPTEKTTPGRPSRPEVSAPNPLPGVRSYGAELWRSPTFTTWGRQAAESLRLFALTPLILTRFETAEIAAWFLFGSLMLFSQVIAGRIMLTFSRMIAFAMAGAKDLSPIRSNKYLRGTGTPDWSLVERTYATIGSLNALLTLAVVGVAGALGSYSLGSIAADHSHPGHIWAAFGIFLGVKAINFFFLRYQVALRGMNYVALVNRWSTVFALLSVLVGFIALSLGANIWQLALAMEVVHVMNVGRMYLVLRFVEDGRFRRFTPYRLDREVITWAWEPFWKGLTISFSNNVIHFAAIVYAKHASTTEVAAFLLTLKLVLAVKQFSDAPFSSLEPRMSRLMAEGQTTRLRELVQRRSLYAQSIFATGALILIVLGDFALSLIGSNTTLLPTNAFILFATVGLLNLHVNLSLKVSVIGNNVICFKQEIASAVASIILSIMLIPQYGYVALIAAAFLPRLALINLRPTAEAAKRLETPILGHLLKSSLPALGVYALLAGGVLILSS